MPILKQLVAGSTNSKRRSRLDLTAEMISAPLGDFRHTMHVGRAGDAFGDTSFLHSKAGEPEAEPPAEAAPAPKPGLLSRRFRGSKRSQSVTRGGEGRDVLGPLRDSALFVKNAVSLPQLNEKEAAEKGAGRLPKSLSSSPVKRVSEEEAAEAAEASPQLNGAGRSPDPILAERAFGDLSDLPVVVPKGGSGMKHAESILSFNIDLGPSMLGEVLSVMDKDEWDPVSAEEEEEGGGCRGDGVPPEAPRHSPRPGRERKEEAAAAGWPPERPARGPEEEAWAGGPSPSSGRSLLGSHASGDGSSVSSWASGGLDPPGPALRGPPPRQPDKDFSFMDEDDEEEEEEEDDEIRV
ncbi:cdc42 effector protein 4 [Tachyglossus aculeatus]|uniref:cdc42 effector protein 4 n=1 Tax=Tachyglossus aculeatus TaxID=9261 RepID=UPI0018F558DC|nr:cdc42 effector protein 4 [Tachyglossus aculeatus]XP_038613334.1 cdc42 effector protein 4 [Tachyglossus aculeatus]